MADFISRIINKPRCFFILVSDHGNDTLNHRMIKTALNWDISISTIAAITGQRTNQELKGFKPSSGLEVNETQDGSTIIFLFMFPAVLEHNPAIQTHKAPAALGVRSGKGTGSLRSQCLQDAARLFPKNTKARKKTPLQSTIGFVGKPMFYHRIGFKAK